MEKFSNRVLWAFAAVEGCAAIGVSVGSAAVGGALMKTAAEAGSDFLPSLGFAALGGATAIAGIVVGLYVGKDALDRADRCWSRSHPAPALA